MNNDSRSYIAYIGTYTRRESFVDGHGAGIYVYRFDRLQGRLDYQSTLTGLVNPSFLALSPRQDRLFAVNEIGRSAGPHGLVSTLAVDAHTGDLSPINAQSTHGFAPCHLCVAASGRYVLVANYQSGSLVALPVSDEGRLEEASDVIRWRGSGPHPRQESPHAHMIVPGPGERTYYAVDLGTDRIRTYLLDEQHGRLQEITSAETHLPPGSGPRHLAFHPNDRFAYTINELASTVTLLHLDHHSGSLAPEQTISTLPPEYDGENLGSEIQIGPGGHFLYASNRGHDSIAIYGIDEMDGRLTPIGHQSTLGRGPRHFTFDPSGEYLLVANQDTHSIVTFHVDPRSGHLAVFGPMTQIPTPVCICFRGIASSP